MKNRKLFLLFHGRFPSEKAASLFAAKSAEVFGEVVNTTLLVPRRISRVSGDSYKYFGIKNNFKIVYIPTIDFFGVKALSSVAFFVSNFVFGVCSTVYLFFKAQKEDIVYSNENIPLYIASYFFKNSFYEMHDFPGTSAYSFYKKLLAGVRGVVIHNTWKLLKANKDLLVPLEKVICEPNAVSVDQFDIPLSKEEARKKLGLAFEGRVVVYTGNLYGWKGVDTLLGAVTLLSKDIRFYFIGGSVGDVGVFKEKYKDLSNCFFLGFKQHEEIPLWQKAADILVIPNTAKEDISKYYTSPMKLFEYMASGRPIVASKIPSIEEIVGEDEVYFFTPDDESSLARTINTALLKDGSSDRKVALAMLKVKSHTWRGRRDRILKFIESVV
jgi:glycosyltransferase involved in cell wall biosynthesis